MDSNKEEYTLLLNKLNIKLKDEDREEDGQSFFKHVMKQWLRIDDILLRMIVLYLPSPVIAQKYRAELLYPSIFIRLDFKL
jgi:elongation factor 2